MKKTRFLLRSIPLVGALLLVACSDPEAPAATDTSEPTTPSAVDEVTFEPAYPEDVSAEELSREDLEQQAPNHTHGDGTAHDHGDGEHLHEDGHHDDEEHVDEEDHGHAH